MFNQKSSRLTASCPVMKVMKVMMMMMMMMMMVTGAAAMPKHSKRSHGAEEEMVPLHISTDAFVHGKIQRPLQNDSISPWTTNDTTEHNLFPPMLSEARCLLRGCLDSEGREDLSLESRPIMHRVMVLRRIRSSKDGHGYHYRVETRLVAVGCTCVRPVVQIQE